MLIVFEFTDGKYTWPVAARTHSMDEAHKLIHGYWYDKDQMGYPCSYKFKEVVLEEQFEQTKLF